MLKSLRFYYDVNSLNVSKKIGLVLFPFSRKNFERQINREGGAVSPRYDLMTPDLYIGSMSFLTFILLCALYFGSQN